MGQGTSVPPPAAGSGTTSRDEALRAWEKFDHLNVDIGVIGQRFLIVIRDDTSLKGAVRALAKARAANPPVGDAAKAERLRSLVNFWMSLKRENLMTVSAYKPDDATGLGVLS